MSQNKTGGKNPNKVNQITLKLMKILCITSISLEQSETYS